MNDLAAIAEHKIEADELDRRQMLLEAVANVSSMLLKTRSPQDTLTDVVRILGEASGQDRVYYFSWHTHPDRGDEVTITLLNEWVQKGVSPQITNPEMQEIPFSKIAPFSCCQLRKGDTISTLVEELSVIERGFLESQEIISILLVPVMIQGNPRGLIGFDNCHSKYHWTFGEKNILAIVADNIANAFVRWEAEEMLRNSNETARAILNSVTESVFLMDLGGDVITANYTTAHRFGLEITDLIGKNIYDYLPGEISRLRKHQVELLIQTGQPCLFEDNRSGTWFEISLYPVLDHTGKIIQVAVYSRDVTDRKLAERQMQATQQELKHLLIEAERSRKALLSVIEDHKEAEDQVRVINSELEPRIKERTLQLEVVNKELEAFSYSISHDLRVPLRALEGFSSALIQDYGNNFDEQAKHYIMRIQEASQRMKQLIEDLLNLSRISRQNMTLHQVDLSLLAEQICDNLEFEFSGQNAEKQIAPNLVVRADPNLMRIVLENLLHNAFKYSSKQSKSVIELGMLDQNGEQVYYVRDNGAGFDMVYADKLFTPFQRLHGAKEFCGTGIGLTIVQRIIARHGGRIWAEAVVNRGATFYFTIPYRINDKNDQT